MTMLTSCIANDNPVTQPDETLKAKLVGQWIVEMTADEVKTASVANGLTLPAGGDKFVYISQFYDDGTGWQELNILMDGILIDQLFNRYDDVFNFIVYENGKVAVKFEGNDEQCIMYNFDGKVLKHGDGNEVTVLALAHSEPSRLSP